MLATNSNETDRMVRRRGIALPKTNDQHTIRVGIVVAGGLLMLLMVYRNWNYSSEQFLSSSQQQSSSFAGIEPWYRELLTKRLTKCHHTSTFFHYFLPHKQCRNKERFGKCDDGAKWLCLDKFQGRTTKRAAALKQKCIIYSFGSSDDSCFETAVAERFDCEIHIFDPTSSELKDPRWTYHSYGLGGADPSITSYWDWRTQKPANCTACPMKNLKDIMKELGHSHVDILKVDIDGAEWRSFEYIYKELKTLPTDQFQIELTGLDITPLTDSSLAGGLDGVYSWWTHVLSDGFALFELEPNYGTCGYRGKERAVSLEYAMWRG
jgi:hypothetical protein